MGYRIPFLFKLEVNGFTRPNGCPEAEPLTGTSSIQAAVARREFSGCSNLVTNTSGRWAAGAWDRCIELPIGVAFPFNDGIDAPLKKARCFGYRRAKVLRQSSVGLSPR